MVYFVFIGIFTDLSGIRTRDPHVINPILKPTELYGFILVHLNYALFVVRRNILWAQEDEECFCNRNKIFF